MWRGGVRWVALSFGWLLACGGRYEQSAPTVDAVGDAGSPTSSSGGVSGSGASNGGGGVASGSGGIVAVAGSPAVSALECVRQFDDYDVYRSQVLTEFSSFTCRLDEDCRAFYDQSSCDPSCRLLVSAAHRGIIDRLNNFEMFNCDPNCWPEPWMTCATPAPVHCVSSRCQLDQ